MPYLRENPHTMDYTHKDIISILSTVTADPEAALLAWEDRKANEPVKEGAHRTFVYSFPVEVGGREVATVTLVDGQVGTLETDRVRLMSKYIGAAAYRRTQEAFNHTEYRSCFIQVHEEFDMPEVVPGLEAMESHFTDAAGNRVAYTLMWGYPYEVDDRGSKNWHRDSKKWHDVIHDNRTYRFLDSEFCFRVEDVKISGNRLGEEINRRIAQRARDRKIDGVIAP